MYKQIFFILLFLSFLGVNAQNIRKIDSLKNILQLSKTDTAKIKILNGLSSQYYNFDLAAALKFAEQALGISKKINNQKCIAESNNSLADVYFYKGDHNKSKEYYKLSLAIYDSLKDKKGIAMNLQDMAYILREEGNYPEAINYYLKAIKINEELGNSKGVAAANVNIGVLFTDQKKYDKALEYLLKGLDSFKKINDPAGLANCYARVGNVYWSQKKFAKAIDCFKLSLEGFSSIGHQRGIAVVYNNMAGLYYEFGDLNLALEYYGKALVIRKKIGDKNGVIIILNNLGAIYIEKKEYDKAVKSLNESLSMATEINFKELIKDNYRHLAKAYSKMNSFNKAYKYHVLYAEMSDSIYNENSSKQFAELNTKYESDKREKEILLLNKEKTIQKFEIDKKKDEIRKHQIIIGFTILVVLIFITLSVFIFRMYKIKRKANIMLAQKNAEIEQQKEEITTQKDYLQELNEELLQQKEEIITQRDEIENSRELLQIQKNIAEEQRDKISEQNMEITNSINYAKYIQKAILMPMEDVMLFFQEHFIFFKPRDIVSGDFYWAKRITVNFQEENTNVPKDYMIVAAADCTGHGVPGAIMSMLGTAYLSEIVNGFTLSSINMEPNASLVLEELRKNIIASLHQTGKSGEQKDGMDIALCIINVETFEMQFAGANNPCWIVRNVNDLSENKYNSSDLDPLFSQCIADIDSFENKQLLHYELIEIQADRIPVGIHFADVLKPFANRKFQLQKDDVVYMFSDGFADQSGGKLRKKLRSHQLRDLMLRLQMYQLEGQKKILSRFFDNWRGEQAQVDDILIMGFKM